MRQTAGHWSYVASRRASSRHGLSPAGRSRRPWLGFTLIELVVAMAILLVVMIGVLSSVAFAYTSSNDTEMRNTTKNVASYTLEYLRSRTVTNPGTGAGSGLAGILGITSTGTYGWYAAGTNSYGAFPSMVDVGNLPVQSNGWPCNYTSAAVKSTTTPKKDGDTNPAGTQLIHFASKHAALPTDKYGTSSTTSLAWMTTLQGYVSIQDRSALGTTLNPAPEDRNVARIGLTGDNPTTGTYRTLLANAWVGLIVRYPGVYPSTQPVIKSFTPLTGYLAKVYTTDGSKVTPSNQEYNPYYTNVGGDKAATQAYRGFRVLTQVVARSTASIDVSNFRHVQYYDVSVTVLWMNGTHESNYELVSRILVY